MLLSWLFFINVFDFIYTIKIPYDSFRGVPISKAKYFDHVKNNNTFFCVNEIEPCHPKEGRRVDGTCNNLKHPSRGASSTPYYRILPAVYDTTSDGYQLRKMSNGKPFPPTRKLRTTIFAEGKVSDQLFTHLVTNYLVYTVSDVTTLEDNLEYILGRSICCRKNRKPDPLCAPNYIPNDDPVFRYTDKRCINMTRPATFQSQGCVNNNTTPERILTTTPLIDLSHMYDTPESLSKYRSYEKGLVKYEIVNGIMWPPRDKNKKTFCVANQGPRETRCHSPVETNSNSLISVNLYFIWFWRNHNRIASALSKMNPCWDDNLLFDTARDINIATMTQILYYELLPSLMGKSNLLRDEVISSDSGFRDIYDEKIIPQVVLEYTYGLRWFHGMQEGSLQMYDEEGNYLQEVPAVELTARTGYLTIDNNIEKLTQGTFRQACAKGDNVVDPDLANRAFGYLQDALDIFSNDIAKGRYFGFQPYVAYRQKCFGDRFKTFDDLKNVFAPERLENLKKNYPRVEDIELMTGISLEKHVEGGFIPETLYCIMVNQLKRFVVSDRHWYERPNRPNAFTEYQLQEIRKILMSSLLCEVGDKVKKIQPNSFLRPGPGNEITNCDKLPHIDLSAWKDESCSSYAQ